jgi:hypothetical protein
MKSYAAFSTALAAVFGYWCYQAEVRLQEAEAVLYGLQRRTKAVEVRIEAIDLKADRTLEVARVTEMAVSSTIRDAEAAIEENKRLLRELRILKTRLERPAVRKAVHEDDDELEEDDPYHG